MNYVEAQACTCPLFSYDENMMDKTKLDNGIKHYMIKEIHLAKNHLMYNMI